MSRNINQPGILRRVGPAWLPLLPLLTLVASCDGILNPGPGGPGDLVADSVAVEPVSAFMAIGDTLHLTPHVFISDGTEIALHPVEWSTSDASVATVEPLEWYAVITGVAPGVAEITVTADEHSAVAIVTVEETTAEVAEARPYAPMPRALDRLRNWDGTTTVWTAAARWLRPEYQRPRFAPEQELIPGTEGISIGPEAAARVLGDWPQDVLDQISALRAAVGKGSGTVEEMASTFRGARRQLVLRHLETLEIHGEVRWDDQGRFHAVAEPVAAIAA